MDEQIIQQGIAFTHLSKLYPDKDYLELIDSFSKLEIQETDCSLCLEPNDGIPIEPCNCIYFKIHSSCLPPQLVKCDRCNCSYGGPSRVLKEKQLEPTMFIYSLTFLRRRRLARDEQVTPTHFRCLGITRSGGRCSRTSINYCHQHRSQSHNQVCVATTGRGLQCTRQAQQAGLCNQHFRVNKCEGITRRNQPCSRRRAIGNFCSQHARIHLQD